jgi:hypothetical protein
MSGEEINMDRKPDNQTCPNDEPTRNALTHMIIKLRWIGLDDEARQLESEARGLPAEQKCGESFGPFSSD